MAEGILGGVILALLGLVAFQHLQIQKLLNKLMSRNYHEYIQSEKIAQPSTGMMSVKEDLDVPDDLRVLQDFQL